MEPTIDRPLDREERYGAAIAGLIKYLPEKPFRRIELYWDYIAKHFTENFAGHYNETKSYNKNELTIWQGFLYIANDVTTAGEFNEAEWTKIDLNEIFKRSRSTSGYFNGGKFYYDAAHTKEIELVEDATYYDEITGVFYIYDHGTLRIISMATVGKYLSNWDCTTGKPVTNPGELPFAYTTGDYYMVTNTGSTNYKPNGSSYTGDASTTVESGTPEVSDIYFYDGTNWTLTKLANFAEYVKKTDYATRTTGGVIKVDPSYGTRVDNGFLRAEGRTYSQYTSGSGNMLIGKGTLENVFAGKKIISTVVLSQAEYDALTEYADNTEYLVY